jgi:hypothetical protein
VGGMIVQTLLLHGNSRREIWKERLCSGGLALMIQPVRGGLLLMLLLGEQWRA